MLWSNSRKLTCEVISEVESKFHIQLPADYKNFIKAHNAAIPELRLFKCGGIEYVLERLLSVEKTDNPNISTAVSWIQKENDLRHWIPFAIDINGNMLCFQTGETVEIVFVDYETQTKQKIANTFTEFINLLY